MPHEHMQIENTGWRNTSYIYLYLYMSILHRLEILTRHGCKERVNVLNQIEMQATEEYP